MDKVSASWLSVFSNLCLVILKLVAGIFMASVGVISEAIHSMLDLLAAGIANVSIRKSVQPPDGRHAYGHGKFENLAGMIEALLIFFVAGIIFYESGLRIIEGSEVQFLEIGIVVMAISVGVNLVVSRLLLKVAEEEDSIALAADGMHLWTDVLTSAGVFIGLILIELTGVQLLDPLIAIMVGVFILRAAWHVARDSTRDLCDERLPQEEEAMVEEVLEKYSSEFESYHSIRTRKSGSERFIDLHISFHPETSVEEAHDLVTHIESDIERAFPSAQVMIHLESKHGDIYME